jgi:hypothetical protein
MAQGDAHVLTTAQGVPVSDDQNTLKIGARGSLRCDLWKCVGFRSRLQEVIARSLITGDRTLTRVDGTNGKPSRFELQHC